MKSATTLIQTAEGNFMKKIAVILILLIPNLISAQVENKADTLEIWTLFSIGDFINQNAERIVEKKWPFKIRGIAGDAFEEGLIDSVEIHNGRIWNYLDSNGYTNSKEKFESDLRVEADRIKKVVAISETNKAVSELLANLRKRKLQNYTELNKVNDNLYEFTIYSYDSENLEKEQVFEGKFQTDLKTEETKMIK